MKRRESCVQTNLSRFTKQLVKLAKKAVVGNLRLFNGEWVDMHWVLISIHGLREYLDQPYRRLSDILHEMSRIERILDLEVHQLPDFSTLCLRMQNLRMPVWRRLLRLSAELHETGEIQAIDATGMDRIAASQHYANRTNYSFKAVKSTALLDCKTGVNLEIIVR